MTSIAAHERALLCALAQQLGPDAPTLCEGWTVKDLVVHLLLREGHPASVGIMVQPLQGLLDRATSKASREDFSTLVTNAPPRTRRSTRPSPCRSSGRWRTCWSTTSTTRTSAGPSRPGSPATSRSRTEDGIWQPLRHLGRGVMMLQSPVAVVAERSDTGDRHVLKKGDREVVVRGLPSEIALYAYGRKAQARVELLGDDADVAALEEKPLGI